MDKHKDSYDDQAPQTQRRGVVYFFVSILISSLILNLELIAVIGWLASQKPASQLHQPETTIIQAREPIAPIPPAKEVVVDWAGVGDTARVGDVEVQIARVGESGPFVRTASRQSVSPYMIIALNLTNLHNTRNIRFTGWSNPQSKIQDETGNLYLIKPFRKGLKLYEDFGSWLEMNPAEEAILYPGKPHHCSLYCEQIGGSEARFTLPAQALEGSGFVWLRKEKAK